MNRLLTGLWACPGLRIRPTRVLTPLLGLLVCAVASGQSFEIYVSDAGGLSIPPYQILKFDDNGENPQVFTDENLAWPQDIVFLEDQNVALISNLNTNRINRHNASTGEYIDVFASDVSGPTRMKIGPDNLLYVLQWRGNGVVKRYQLDGTPTTDFTSVRVNQSIGLDWTATGELLVSSFNDAAIRRFDQQGADQGLFITQNLVGPTNLLFDTDGSLLVTDWSAGLVRRFDASGGFIGNVISGLIQPEGIARLPNGNLLVGNGGPGSVRMYDTSGNFLQDFIAAGAGGLIQPNAVIVRELAGTTFSINSGLNDAWFNVETPGQGIMISVLPDSEQLFLAWFTFDSSAPAESSATLGGAGQRWLTAQGSYSGNTATLSVFVTTGGVFDAAAPVPSTEADGTITLRFDSCEAATLTYQLDTPGLSGEISLSRIANDNIALCETLAAMP